MELSEIKSKINNSNIIYNNNKEMKENNPIDNQNKSKHMRNNHKKNLPENFFEKVIEYEMKLKYDFSMQTLNELVDLFSVKKFYYLLLNILFRPLLNFMRARMI